MLMANPACTMLDLYKISWAKNWGFSPLSDGEAEHHVKELKGVLDPEFFVLFFHNNEPAAGMRRGGPEPALGRTTGGVCPWLFAR